MDDWRHPASRRRFLAGSAAVLGTTILAGCDAVGSTPWTRRILDKDENANFFVQRLLLSDQKLAPEYPASEISPWFKPNGTADPPDRDYRALAKTNFQTFRLKVEGLVERPLALSLAELRALPSRTQITRHDCVEGWSCIGQWTGIPLAALLQQAGLKPDARFVVFFCADTMDQGGGLDSLDQSSTADDSGGGDKDATASDASDRGGKAGDGNDAKATMTPDDPSARQADTGGKAKGGAAKAASETLDPGPRYYESVDLTDAFHPQTILAYEMNGKPLPVAHGAPLRLRLERQLGYKMAKYVMRIVVVDRLETVGKGGGGYWEDNGYEWYAGI